MGQRQDLIRVLFPPGGVDCSCVTGKENQYDVGKGLIVDPVGSEVLVRDSCTPHDYPQRAAWCQQAFGTEEPSRNLVREPKIPSADFPAAPGMKSDSEM